MNSGFTFINIFDGSVSKYERYIRDVISLWRSYSNRLGELPDKDKIRTYISKQKLVLAVSVTKECVAYAMFREKEQAAKILHVCVRKDFRNNGLARTLVERVIHEAQHLYEVRVSCRRDYGLNDFWSSLGFIAMSDRSGRNRNKDLITEWILNYGRPNLLTILHEQAAKSKLCAVIDTNVFIDLVDENPQRNVEDSKVLASDFLYPDTEFFLTSEIYNDINRISDNQQRDKTRKKISNYQVITPSKEKTDNVRGEIRRYFPDELTSQDTSDMGHLAIAIANNCDCFITRDSGLLKLDSDIYKEFGIPILRPSDFIIYIDELLQASKYQPSRFSNTSIQVSRIGSGEQDLLARYFLNFKLGEKGSDFKSILRHYLSSIDAFECQTLKESETSELIALYVLDRQNSKELKVPLLRVNESTSFAKSLSRHLAFTFIKMAFSEGRYFVKVSDSKMSQSVQDALMLEKFFAQGESYMKCAFPFIGDIRILSEQVNLAFHTSGKSDEYSLCRENISSLLKEEIIQDPTLVSDIEKVFYPVKVSNADIPNYIIPIQPRWAEELIDEDLASLLLLGAQKELMLRREMVYYRACRPRILDAPARILWYVSKPKHGRQFPNIMSIKACSSLDEVIVGEAESLYKQFRRYGIYGKEDVFNISKSGPKGQIMAIRFSNTQQAIKPIDYKRIHEILAPKKPPLITPYEISKESFTEIYKEGFLK